MLRHLVLKLLTPVIGLLLAGVDGSAATLTLFPSSQLIASGSNAEMAINISGLGSHSAPSLGTFDLTVSFNAFVLAFDSVSFGDPLLGDQLALSGFGSTRSTTPTLNSESVFELSLDPASILDAQQAQAFTLLILHFTAEGSGPAELSLTSALLGDSGGNTLVAAIHVHDLTVAAVPEPRWTILTSLLVIAFWPVCKFAARAAKLNYSSKSG